MFKYYLKGFTIVEVLVTLALTSIVITFSYSALSYVQKLFLNYKDQNRFINEYSDFKRRMDYEALYAHSVVETSENVFVAFRDSLQTTIELLDRTVLMKRSGHCDTFHFSVKQIVKSYEMIRNPKYANRLLKTLSFETEFSKQKFNFRFYKHHDASLKLQMDNVN